MLGLIESIIDGREDFIEIDSTDNASERKSLDNNDPHGALQSSDVSSQESVDSDDETRLK